MRFIEFINKRRYLIFCCLLSVYLTSSLLEGERGLISFYKNQEEKKMLIQENKILVSQLELVERKNILLSEKIDLDYLEILFRKKFMFGKPNERIFSVN